MFFLLYETKASGGKMIDLTMLIPIAIVVVIVLLLLFKIIIKIFIIPAILIIILVIAYETKMRGLW